MSQPQASVDTGFVDEAVERLGRRPEATIALLQALQEHYGWLPPAALRRACELTEITAARIHGVSTFYTQFRHRPAGRHTVRVCVGTACHVKGAVAVFDALHRHLQIPADDDTDPERLFTVEKVACLGCCALAPAVQIDDVVYGHLSPDGVGRMLHDFLEQAEHRPPRPKRRRPGPAARRGEVRIGMGSCCIARGSGRVHEALVRAVGDAGLDAVVKPVACMGMPHQTPLVEIVGRTGRTFRYARVQPDDAADIVLRHFRPRGAARRVGRRLTRALESLLTDEAWAPVTRYATDVRDPPVAAFMGRQVHVATEHAGRIAPTDLDEYLDHGGFEGLRRCLTRLGGEQIIDGISRSGLRGRGGAGFPTGRKWASVRAAPGEVKYVVCNGDEGDPGAFMDRMLLESYPFRVLEGMAIAARAVGAREGVLYIRAEYPLAVRRVREAIDACRARGLLGEDLMGSGEAFDARVVPGAGAFVCGEETALLASIEGRRGMPRYRPPYPAERGLWGRPTLVNNTETLAVVPWIVRHGPEAFARMGTAASKGTKVFALAGKVRRGGLIEVPMGITLREIVEQIGGGVADGKALKAVQVGGPSGGCVPAALCDTPVDYEALTGVGAIMGSGGLVVLDADDCMVDIARYFLEFTQDQSCGKCTFCRLGTRRMLEILQRLCEGRARRGDLEELHRLAEAVGKGSLCGLGKTAPKPVLSTLRYFHDEYEAHVAGRCPAAKCKALITYSITEDCIGCTRCAQRCPAEAIAMRPHERHEIDPDKCVRCDTCREVCPVGAIHRRDRGGRENG
jgi:NADH-quinone oxidoreductase subunit F